tara:strand:- start:1759 stop:2244 length:486 start_codon:yes stop_codon:yes gene_type:complete
MISVEVLLKHMAWSNQEIYKEVKKLGNEVLDYYVIDPEWTVRNILIHIVGAGHLYGQRLDGDSFSAFKLENDADDLLIDQLLIELKRIDNGLIKYANVEDGDLTYMTTQGERTSKISTIISQMIFHAAEHRAQLVAALDKHNIREINLDHYSVFAYIETLK